MTEGTANANSKNFEILHNLTCVKDRLLGQIVGYGEGRRASR